MPHISDTARVADGARVADDVEIGPFCLVGSDVQLQAGVRLVSHVSVSGHTTVGERTIVYPFASLGAPPQSTHYRGGPTRLVIGSECQIRENVTMNVGSEDGGGVTEVGDRGFFMAGSHVAHDCRIGNDVVFANGATLGGHCIVGDHVFIGGLSAAHQFSTIGAHAMIGGLTAVWADVIPFGCAARSGLTGLNIVGMKRRKFSAHSIRAARHAYRQLFFGEGTFADRVGAVEACWGAEAAVAAIIRFVRQQRHRPLMHPAQSS